MNFKFWKKKSVIEVLNQHLAGFTRDEKIDHLKTIIPRVCEGVNVSKHPPKGRKKTKKVLEAERIE